LYDHPGIAGRRQGLEDRPAEFGSRGRCLLVDGRESAIDAGLLLGLAGFEDEVDGRSPSDPDDDVVPDRVSNRRARPDRVASPARTEGSGKRPEGRS
jgi:hypothetical protein